MFEPLPTIIRLRRKQLGLSLNTLATLANVSRSRLAMLEKGDDNITLELLLRIAHALQLKEIHIGGMAPAASPDLGRLLAAAEAIQDTQKILDQVASLKADLERIASRVSALLAPVLPPASTGDALPHFGAPPAADEVPRT